MRDDGGEAGAGDGGARHAKAFLVSMRTGGKLNETLLVPMTNPVKAPFDLPFALKMVKHGKAPSPIPHRIKKLKEVQTLMKNVKETI